MKRPIALATTFAAVMTFAAFAADDKMPATVKSSAKLTDLAWMVGTWNGKPDAGHYCETWGRAQHGAMLGMCHMTNKKGAATYELIAIEEGPNGLTYRIMHYAAGLKAKHDEPKAMPLIETGDGKVVFMETSGDSPARVSYRREGADGMVARVEHVKNGHASGFGIPMTRAK